VPLSSALLLALFKVQNIVVVITAVTHIASFFQLQSEHLNPRCASLEQPYKQAANVPPPSLGFFDLEDGGAMMLQNVG
jgi:hypothetical protein